MSATLNEVDAPAWLADLFARTADHPVERRDELPPWHKLSQAADTIAAA